MTGTTSSQRGATRTYRLGVGLAAIGLGLAAAALAALLAVVSTRPAPAHEISVIGQRLAVPAANAQAIVLLTLATLGISVVLAIVRGLIVVMKGQHRLRRALPVLDRLPGHDHVWIVLGDRPDAFCVGLLHPRIYISTGALRELDEEQLAAVLAHENLHRIRRDPLRLVSARVLGQALFFLPAVRRLGAHYRSLAELAADDHAVATLGGDTSALAGAMLAFADGGIEPERVDHLTGQTPEWALPVGLVAMSLLGAAGLALAVWQLARHAILQTTLALPLLSKQPCIVMLALVPLAGTALGLWNVRRVA